MGKGSYLFVYELHLHYLTAGLGDGADHGASLASQLLQDVHHAGRHEAEHGQGFCQYLAGLGK